MSRFLVIAADGETIVGLLNMDPADAALNIAAGESLIAFDPDTDTGAVFIHDQVTVDLTGADPVFIDVVTGLPSEDENLTDIALEDVTP